MNKIIEDDFFLYEFLKTRVIHSLPLNSDNDLVNNFKIHQDKLKIACWCLAVAKMQKNHARIDFVEKRIKQLTTQLRKINSLLPKARRSQFWIAMNNEKHNYSS
jgi:hypothetical protein